jgi:hypothetical protein
MTDSPPTSKPLLVVAIVLLVAFAEAFVWLSGAKGWD